MSLFCKTGFFIFIGILGTGKASFSMDLINMDIATFSGKPTKNTVGIEDLNGCEEITSKIEAFLTPEGQIEYNYDFKKFAREHTLLNISLKDLGRSTLRSLFRGIVGSLSGELSFFETSVLGLLSDILKREDFIHALGKDELKQAFNTLPEMCTAHLLDIRKISLTFFNQNLFRLCIADLMKDEDFKKSSPVKHDDLSLNSLDEIQQ